MGLLVPPEGRQRVLLRSTSSVYLRGGAALAAELSFLGLQGGLTGLAGAAPLSAAAKPLLTGALLGSQSSVVLLPVETLLLLGKGTLALALAAKGLTCSAAGGAL